MDYLALLRQYRIGPFAIFDTALAFGGVYLLSPLLTKLFLKLHLNISRSSWLWLTLPISVIFHVILQQNTPLMKALMVPGTGYIIIFLLAVMAFFGLKDIKKA